MLQHTDRLQYKVTKHPQLYQYDVRVIGQWTNDMGYIDYRDAPYKGWHGEWQAYTMSMLNRGIVITGKSYSDVLFALLRYITNDTGEWRN